MGALVEFVLSVTESKFVDLKEIRRKRQERIMAAYSEANSKISPNEDSRGRLHAPCDGYEDVDGKGVYAKGEFLPIPEIVFEQLEMEGITCNRGQKEFGLKTRLMVGEEEGEEIAALFRSFGLGCSFGKTFEKSGKLVKYMYICGNDALVKEIEEAIKKFKDKEAEKLRLLKGNAPEGKVTVSGTIIFIKKFVPINAYDHGTDKMMVELENKSTVWGTLPSCISHFEIGDDVVFSATFTRAYGDKTHAFFKRPVMK